MSIRIRPVISNQSPVLEGALRELHSAAQSRDGWRRVLRNSSNLDESAEKVASELEVNMPVRLRVVHAFTSTARSTKHTGVIKIAEKNLYVLSGEELEASLAHELSHIKNRDTRTHRIYRISGRTLSRISGLAVIATGIAIKNKLNTDLTTNAVEYWAIVAAATVGVNHTISTVFEQVEMIHTRQVEKRADRAAVKVAGLSATLSFLFKAHDEDELISAVEDIVNGRKYTPKEIIGHLKPANLLKNLKHFRYGTHPTDKQRVKNVVRYADELACERILQQ